MKHVFIVNKISGKGTAYKIIDKIENICKSKGLDYQIHITEYPEHAKELSKQYNDKEDATIYAVGGDGTILEVINGLDNKQELGIIPAGSGNDYYRYFGGVNTDFDYLINSTIDNEFNYVDVGKTDRMLFLNTTSIGIDAKINLDASAMIRKTIITKGPAYILSIIKNIIILKPCKIKMFVDGKDYSGEYFIVSCMNGKYYGNGVMAAPNADLMDGYFDLVMFKKTSRIKTYLALVKYLKGKATKQDGVERIRCKEVIIDSNEDMASQSDGENFWCRHLEIKIMEKYLKLKFAD